MRPWSTQEDAIVMDKSYPTPLAISLAVDRTEKAVELRAKYLGRKFKVEKFDIARCYRLGHAARMQGKRKCACPGYSTLGQQVSWKAGWHDACIQLGDPCYD